MTLAGAPERLIVRGEVFMPKKVFHAINAQRELDGENLLANPRNGAAGSLRQQDPKVAAKRRLDVQIFNIQLMEGREPFETDSAALDWLESLDVYKRQALATSSETAGPATRFLHGIAPG